MDPALEAILQLVKCGCTKTNYTTLRCKMHKQHKLFCTELCTCGAEDEYCDNVILDECIDGDSFN